MIKILYTINFLTNGGPTRVLENIIKNLNMNEFEIYILTFINENNKKIVSELENKGIKIIALNYHKNLKEILKHRNCIVKKINNINPDIVHCHGIVSAMILCSNKIKIKKIATIHNNIFEDYKYTYGKVKGIIYAYIHIFMLKKFNEVICCSKTSYKTLKKFIKKTIYIRNGIDIENEKTSSHIRKEIRKQLNIEENDLVYIYGGVINSRKRVIDLVKMFNNNLLNNEYLIIVGDGDLKNKAEEIKTNNNIIFTGFKENIIDYFKAADIYVSYSSSEGFSISIIEALECELLLFLSDIPSHKECFEIDNNVYIGEFFCQKNFVKKKRKISHNLNKINKEVLYDFQQKYLSSKVMTNQYIGIYKNLKGEYYEFTQNKKSNKK